MQAVAAELETVLDHVLPADDVPERPVLDAMRYASLGGGKRLRPFLLLNAALLFGVSRQAALRAAAAVEMVHCYSLVHDDLPCMDDDDLRRGRPTCHRQFDEATALLAGDALLTGAFEVLAEEATHPDPLVRAELVRELALAAGGRGMVGGQMMDLLAPGLDLDMAGITRLQQMKTGRLIRFSCEAGAIMGKAALAQRHALAAYAHDLGLAFQIADDLLDVEGSADQVGKRVGKDADAGKATFVSLLGADGARTQAAALADQACAHLEPFGDRAAALRAVAGFVIDRKV